MMASGNKLQAELRKRGHDRCIVADCRRLPVVLYHAETQEGEKDVPACGEHDELVGRAECIVREVDIPYGAE